MVLKDLADLWIENNAHELEVARYKRILKLALKRLESSVGDLEQQKLMWNIINELSKTKPVGIGVCEEYYEPDFDERQLWKEQQVKLKKGKGR